jgi:glutathione S-transferase
MALNLVIGNKNYSSWSLHAWLYLRESRIPFEEIRIPLYTGDWAQQIARYSPAQRVPVLIDGDLHVWDSIAIFEYIHEHYPQAVGWPSEVAARTHARCITAEMHAGFLAVREELPLNVRARKRRQLSELSEAAQAQVARIIEMWTSCRRAHRDRGPWLFGQFSIADVMYAPVALRFVTYQLPLTAEAQEFVRRVGELPSIQEWMREAEAEIEVLPFIDEVVPARGTPLSLG